VMMEKWSLWHHFVWARHRSAEYYRECWCREIENCSFVTLRSSLSFVDGWLAAFDYSFASDAVYSLSKWYCIMHG
jgi:hypothetical protein